VKWPWQKEQSRPPSMFDLWNEPVDHEQLADNFAKIDAHDGSSGRGVYLGSPTRVHFKDPGVLL